MRKVFVFFVFLFYSVLIADNNYLDSIISDLKSNPDIKSIEKVKTTKPFVATYRIFINQKLDHFSDNSKTFSQQIYFSYVDSSRPNVLVTEGYDIYGNFTRELSKLLNANQIVVEHRFFNKSVPENIEWKYLNIKQEAADYHYILFIFKKYLKGKWVSTGRSKGGQTTLFYRRFYPDDVYASVPYVAPFNFALEDPRIDSFIVNNGSKECRDKILNFQLHILDNEDKCIDIFKKWAKKNKVSFDLIGIEKIFEYAVLEYPFTFWQWGNTSCDSIPINCNEQAKLFKHLSKVIPLRGYYSDKSVKASYPAFYQFCTQLGYYGYYYNDKEVLDKLKYLKHPTNLDFTPPNVEIRYDPNAMKDVKNWINSGGLNRFLMIYGELDPWRATAIDIPDNGKDSYKFILKGGNHRAKILDFPFEERMEIFNILEKWFDVKIDNKFKERNK